MAWLELRVALLGIWLIAPLTAQGQTDCSKQIQIPRPECEALLQIHRDFGSFDQEGWNQDNLPCEWRGVHCNSGHVTGLEIKGEEVVGNLSPALGSLSELEYLGLIALSLKGPFPEEMAKLRSLELLFISEVAIDGPFPQIFTQLRSLRDLWVIDSGLTGPIPREIENLTRLEGLHLSDNELSGPLPKEIGGLVDLEGLWTDNNLLTAIPGEIAGLRESGS